MNQDFRPGDICTLICYKTDRNQSSVSVWRGDDYPLSDQVSPGTVCVFIESDRSLSTMQWANVLLNEEVVSVLFRNIKKVLK